MPPAAAPRGGAVAEVLNASDLAKKQAQSIAEALIIALKVATKIVMPAKEEPVFQIHVRARAT